MKSISIFGYIKVVILFVITIFVVFVLSNYYRQKIQYDRQSQDAMGFLFNVKYDELSNFLVEKHDTLIYMSPSSDATLDSFEEELKQYILELELEKEFAYLDSSNFSSDMYEEFVDKFFASDTLKEKACPNSSASFLAVENRKVIDVLCINSGDATMNVVEPFVNMHVVVQ